MVNQLHEDNSHLLAVGFTLSRETQSKIFLFRPIQGHWKIEGFIGASLLLDSAAVVAPWGIVVDFQMDTADKLALICMCTALMEEELKK